MDHAVDKQPVRALPASMLGQLTQAPRPAAASLLLAASVVVWALSLGAIDLEQISDVGLIAALPATFFSAVFLLTASFVIAVGTRCFALVPVQLVVQVLMFFGTPSLVEYGPRTQSAWRLAGIVDHIAETHTIDRSIDAFFNWPGFFILLAFVVKAAGLPNSLGLAEWAPVAFNLAYAVPLFVIFRKLALTEPQIWVALWLFFATNWIGQDYLSPQAFAFLIYLIILAILVSVFRPPAEIDGGAAENGDPALRRMLAVAFVIVLFAVIVPSHQLTPWMVTISVTALVLVRRLPSFGLPAVMAVMATTWVVFFTGPFLSGHFADVARPVGSITSNVEQNLGGRFEGSVGHLLVLQVRVGLSAAMCGLAAWGVLRLRSVGAPVRTIVALGVAPFLMLAFQSYGGELLLRIFLFSLPFIVLAAAAVFTIPWTKHQALRTVVAVVALLAIPALFFTARYGNERADFFTEKEIAAVEYLYAHAPQGAQVVAAYDNVPWRFSRYTDYEFHVLEQSAVSELSIPEILGELSEPRPTYLLLTRSQAEAGELYGGWKDGTLTRLQAKLVDSDHFSVLFANEDATVLKLRGI
jgi:hypothetical protein